VSELLFQPPQFDKAVLHHIFNNCNTLVQKLKKKLPLTNAELKDLQELPTNYLICALNNFEEATKKLNEVRSLLRNLEDKSAYIKYKEAVRVLRKIKS